MQHGHREYVEPEGRLVRVRGALIVCAQTHMLWSTHRAHVSARTGISMRYSIFEFPLGSFALCLEWFVLSLYLSIYVSIYMSI